LSKVSRVALHRFNSSCLVLQRCEWAT